MKNMRIENYYRPIVTVTQSDSHVEQKESWQREHNIQSLLNWCEIIASKEAAWS